MSFTLLRNSLDFFSKSSYFIVKFYKNWCLIFLVFQTVEVLDWNANREETVNKVESLIKIFECNGSVVCSVGTVISRITSRTVFYSWTTTTLRMKVLKPPPPLKRSLLEVRTGHCVYLSNCHLCYFTFFVLSLQQVQSMSVSVYLIYSVFM